MFCRFTHAIFVLFALVFAFVLGPDPAQAQVTATTSPSQVTVNPITGTVRDFTITFSESVEILSIDTSGVTSTTTFPISNSNTVHTISGLSFAAATGSSYAVDFKVRKADDAEETVAINVALETTPPTLVSLTPLPVYLGSTANAVTATFSEEVYGFTIASLDASSNLSLSGLEKSSTDPKVWTFNVIANNNGSVSVGFKGSNGIEDFAGNDLAATSLSLASTADFNDPSLTSITFQENGAPVTVVKGSQLTAVVTFSEPVSGVDTADFAINPNFAFVIEPVAGTDDIMLDGGDTLYKTYHLNMTLGTLSNGQNITVKLADAAVVNDKVGNRVIVASSPEGSIVYDPTRPTVTLSGLADHFNDDQTVTFTFSEPVDNFDVGDIEFTNAEVASGATLTANADDTIYTLLIHPQTDGLVQVGLKSSNNIEDKNGNALQTATPDEGTYDATSPEPSFTGIEPGSTITDREVSFTTAFNEAIDPATFTTSDLSVTNAVDESVTLIQGTGDQEFSVTIRPLSTGDVTVELPANRVDDLAGNGNAASSVLTLEYNDQNGPFATFDLPAKASSGFTATVTFDETIQNPTLLSLDAFSITEGASLSNLVYDVNSEGKVFSFDVAVTGPEQAYTVTLKAGQVSDSASNQNLVTSDSFIWDKVVPMITSLNLFPGNITVNGETPFSETIGPKFYHNPVKIRLIFDKPVRWKTSTTANGKQNVITEGKMSFNSYTPAYAEDSYSTTQVITATVTVPTEEAIDLNFEAGLFVDEAGNENTAFSEVTYFFDPVKPTVTITAPAEANSKILEASFTVSEEVEGFEQSDIIVTNGEVISWEKESDLEYKATIRPIVAGDVTIRVSADAFTDTAGNTNDLSALTTVVFAPEKPFVHLSGLEGTITGPVTVTVNFVEPVTGFEIGDITVTNGAASAFTETTSGRVWTVLVTPVTAGQAVTVSVLAGAATAQTGDAPSEVSNTLSATYDGTDPELLSIVSNIKTLTGASQGTQKLQLVATFSENMKTSVTPTFLFEDQNDNPIGFLTNLNGSWDGAVYTATFDVLAMTSGYGSINITVSGAEDLSGRAVATKTIDNVLTFTSEGQEVKQQQNEILAANRIEATRSAIQLNRWAIGKQISSRFQSRLRGRDPYFGLGAEQAPMMLSLHSSDLNQRHSAEERAKLDGLDGELRASIGRNSRAYITRDDQPAFWFSSGYSDQRFSKSDLDLKGQQVFGRVGGDFFLNRNLLVGFTAGINAKETEINQLTQTKLKGIDFTTGVYAGYLLGGIVTFEAAAEYSLGSSDISTETTGNNSVTGSFDSNRFTAYLKSSVIQEITSGVDLSHSLSLQYGTEKTDAYETSTAVEIASQTTSIGSLNYAAKLQQHDLLIEGMNTYLQAEVDYVFQKAEASDLGAIDSLSEENARFSLGAGVDTKIFNTGSSVSLDAHYNGVGSDNRVLTLQGGINVPF